VSGQLRKRPLEPLALVPSIHKQRYRPLQGPDTPRKTAVPSGQPGQIVPQFRVVTLDAVGLTLTEGDPVCAWIHKLGIGREAVTEITMSRRGVIDHLLHSIPVSVPDHAKAQDAARVPVYTGDDVRWLFFWETKV